MNAAPLALNTYPAAEKDRASVMLPGEIPYLPHPWVASALLHLQCAKQFSGREDWEGKPPFFVWFHRVR